MGSKLWLPPSHVIHNREPKYECGLCGKPFYEGEQAAYERHCLKDHDLAELQQHSLKAQAPGLFDDEWEGADAEWGRWIREHRESDPHGWRRWMKTSLDK